MDRLFSSSDAFQSELLPALTYLNEARELALQAKSSGFQELFRYQSTQAVSSMIRCDEVIRKIAHDCLRLDELHRSMDIDNSQIPDFISKEMKGLDQEKRSIHELLAKSQAVQSEIDLKTNELARIQRRVSELRAMAEGDPEPELAAEYAQVYAEYVTKWQNLEFISHELSSQAVPANDSDSAGDSEEVIEFGDSV